jgi:hypothetical protein
MAACPRIPSPRGKAVVVRNEPRDVIFLRKLQGLDFGQLVACIERAARAKRLMVGWRRFADRLVLFQSFQDFATQTQLLPEFIAVALLLYCLQRCMIFSGFATAITAADALNIRNKERVSPASLTDLSLIVIEVSFKF